MSEDRPHRHEPEWALQQIVDDEMIGPYATRAAQRELDIRKREYAAGRGGTSDPQTEPTPAAVRSMKLCLPLPPNRANARGHWTARHNTDSQYRFVLDSMKSALMLPTPPIRAWRRVRVRSKLYVWNIMDEDNAMARLKVAIDWLVMRGYITDDRRENIEWAGVPEQEIDRECPRLVLRISQPKG